jgi:hypothetical protein
MTNSNKRMNQSPDVRLRYIEAKDVFVLQQGETTMLVSANLIRHQLGIPYTKKDGTKVSKTQIEASNLKSRKAYIRAIEKNASSRPKPKKIG